MNIVHGYSMSFGMILIMIIYLLSLFGVGVYFIRYFIKGSQKQNKQSYEILNEQFVKGEISEETYERLKRSLKE